MSPPSLVNTTNAGHNRMNSISHGSFQFSINPAWQSSLVLLSSAHLMTRPGPILGLILSVLALSGVSQAEQSAGTPWSIESLAGGQEGVLGDLAAGTVKGTNGVVIRC